jgi:hypothetical protein
VDVVGQAGKPKAITGFATHTTPVLVAYDQVSPPADSCHARRADFHALSSLSVVP